LRRKPIEDRKHQLSRLVRTPRPGIVVNEHYDGDGETVFKYACKLGCEGIVMCAWRGNTVEIGDIQRISATAKAFASIRSWISCWRRRRVDRDGHAGRRLLSLFESAVSATPSQQRRRNNKN